MSLRRKVATTPDGYSISYLVDGAGPVLVMIPGILESAARWAELGYIEHFAGEARVIAIDPLGHGDSDAPTTLAAYGPEAVVGQIGTVLEAEDVTAGVIWGYGEGAATALHTARRRPGAVAGVVLGGMYLGDIAEGIRELDLEATAVIERAAGALEKGDWDGYFAASLWDAPPELRARARADNDAAVVAAIIRAHHLRPRGFVVPPMPTLAYWGRDDVFAAANARLVEGLPIEWTVVPGGHSDGFVRADAVLAAVQRFVESVLRG